jgi:hypothetical protein
MSRKKHCTAEHESFSFSLPKLKHIFENRYNFMSKNPDIPVNVVTYDRLGR